jgi:hypothetical protein
MSLERIAKKLVLLAAVGAAVLATAAPTPAWFFDGWCKCGKCPPPYIHCTEGPPRLKYKCACPKPVCEPCSLERWGYYQNCWHPWPFPPDWSHCPTPPSGALVPPDCCARGGVNTTPDAVPLPAPRPMPPSTPPSR